MIQKTFNFPQVLYKLSQSGKSGQLLISENSVTWEINLVDGKLQSASHSLQSPETVKHYLLSLGYKIALSPDTLTPVKTSEDNPQVFDLLEQLSDKNLINASQKSALKRELVQESLESLVLLNQGAMAWHPQDNTDTVTESLLEIPPILQNLLVKAQKWQKFAPYITSPHQRPQCVKPELLDKLKSDNSSTETLKYLVKYMRGFSIRQLALLVKQDETKISQLLYPFIKQQIIEIHPPKSPFDRLPSPLSSQAKSTEVESKAPDSIVPSKPKVEKRYQIVCIDDSPAVLEIIQSYLPKERYEITGIDNPMKSMSYLFEKKPDLILMDISMPGINGNRLCQILKSSSAFQNIPVIMVSGNTKLLSTEKIQEMGASDYLAKPFTQQGLQKVINKYLA